MWKTDFTYFKIIGGAGWKLCSTMRSEYATDKLDMAITASGPLQTRLLNDN